MIRYSKRRKTRGTPHEQSVVADDIRVVGEPMAARYSGPFTPWLMRRNEIIVPAENGAAN